MATFRVLFVLTAWTRQQICEAFPWDQTPRYLLRDRDAIYGADFGHRLRGFGIEEVVSAPHAPWQKRGTQQNLHPRHLPNPRRWFMIDSTPFAY
jgi:hypothetical protein